LTRSTAKGLIITSNKAFGEWWQILANDANMGLLKTKIPPYQDEKVAFPAFESEATSAG